MTLKMMLTDWLTLKTRYWVLIFSYVCVITTMIVFNISAVIILPLAGWVAMGGAMDTFFLEEKNKLHNLYLSLPLTRKSIVRARFVYTLIHVLFAMVITTGIAILSLPYKMGEATFDFQPKTIIMLSLIGFAFSGIGNISTYPLTFRFGNEKGGYGALLNLLIIVGGVGFFGFNFKDELRDGSFEVIMFNAIKYFTENASNMINIISLVSLGVGILLYALSYFISVKLYERKSM